MVRHRLFSMRVIMNSVTVDNVYGHEPDMDEVARLPGEGLDHAGSSTIGEVVPGEAPGTSGPDQRAAGGLAAGRKVAKRNIPLYAGVALVAVLIAGGYVYRQPAISPHQVQATQAATVGPAGPPAAIAPLAPAAALAKVPVPHMPAAVIHQKYVPQPPATQLSELYAFRAGAQETSQGIPSPQKHAGAGETTGLHKTAPQAPANNSASGANPALQPGKSASSALLAVPTPLSPSPQAGSITGLASPGGPDTVATALAQKPASVVSTAVVVKPVNPPAAPGKTANLAVANRSALTIAPAPPAGASLAAAQAGSLSPAQQTTLYQLVTQLGTLERNDEIRQAVLAGQVQQLTLLVSGKMADYDRRLSMLEAQTVVSGAVQAASTTAMTAAIAAAPPAAASAPASKRSALSSSTGVGATIPPASPSSGPAAALRYHVQAASPGLAMLSAVGGDGSPLEVQTGDIIAGYGKVLGVVQQGESWVVQTQSGNIE
jgi:hypothetical protein